ncbi:MAG TPA: PQQ-binding-like beta-propeller repeat protein, partial [Novosphingobium sp.]|nr:PQQ-binding-like beta-propeller repeat protein [Novosphingobium sp.]
MAENMTSADGNRDKPREKPRFVRRPFLFAALLILIGGGLIWGGVQLASLGGSPYYLAAGLATLASGVLILSGRAVGALVYGLMLLATVAWAVGEVGSDPWQLAARVTAPVVLGLWLLLPWTRAGLGLSRRIGRGAAVKALGATVGAVAIGFAAHALFVPTRADPMYQAGVTGLPAATVSAASTGAAAADWPSWGGDPGGTRFSALDQITPKNADKLELAWTYHFGPPPPGAPKSLEVTPLKVGDTLYLCNDYNDVVALDAETGAQRWRFRAHTDTAGATYGHCRGVAYLRSAATTGACAARIYTATVDARLLAIDAATGQLCGDFGRNGAVDLKEGMSKAP